MAKPKICFHGRGHDYKMFELFDYYSNDVRIFKELGYDVILSYKTTTIPNDCDLYFIWWWSSGIIPLIKAKLLKKPIITIGNIHYSDPSDQGYFQRPFYIRTFIRYCLRHSDVQIATANIEFEDIKKLNAKNPILIYHAIDTDRYFFSKYQNRGKFLLTLTQLTKENAKRKKVKEIIRAFKLISDQISDYSLYIAGRTEDSGFPEIKELVHELGLDKRVKFLGRVSNEEKVKLYQTCKIYVQPTSYEGFGMAIAENMSCGTPVITSDRGAVREVAGDLAVYVDPDKIEDIADGMIKLINDEKLYLKLHVEGRDKIVQNFSLEIRKNKMKELLEKYI